MSSITSTVGDASQHSPMYMACNDMLHINATKQVLHLVTARFFMINTTKFKVTVQRSYEVIRQAVNMCSEITDVPKQI